MGDFTAADLNNYTLTDAIHGAIAVLFLIAVGYAVYLYDKRKRI